MPTKKSTSKTRKSSSPQSHGGKRTQARDYARADKALREHVLYLLKGGGAHVTFDDAIADLPADALSQKPPNAEHSVWQLVEHLRMGVRHRSWS